VLGLACLMCLRPPVSARARPKDVGRCRYAARVNNPRTYDAVSRDVLRRWAFPFAPDTNVLPLAGDPSFRLVSHGVYQCAAPPPHHPWKAVAGLIARGCCDGSNGRRGSRSCASHFPGRAVPRAAVRFKPAVWPREEMTRPVRQGGRRAGCAHRDRQAGHGHRRRHRH